MHPGIGHLILETDAQEVVQAIKIGKYLDTVVGHLLAEIKALASFNMLSFECVFRGRTGN